jgi:DNA-directed RNA polymerase I, II, and III subunit RPABC5
MLIPVRCFTCNNVIGDKYILFVDLSEKYMKEQKLNADDIRYIDTSKKNIEFSPYGLAMNELGLTKMCCRRHMMGHVDVIDDI